MQLLLDAKLAMYKLATCQLQAGMAVIANPFGLNATLYLWCNFPLATKKKPPYTRALTNESAATTDDNSHAAPN